MTHGTSFLLDSSLCALYSLFKWKRDCYEKLLLKLSYHVAAVANHITSFANCRITLTLNVNFFNKIFQIIRKFKEFSACERKTDICKRDLLIFAMCLNPKRMLYMKIRCSWCMDTFYILIKFCVIFNVQTTLYFFKS